MYLFYLLYKYINVYMADRASTSKTLYVRPDDVAIWKKADEVAKAVDNMSLSALITEYLKRYVNQKHYAYEAVVKARKIRAVEH